MWFKWLLILLWCIEMLGSVNRIGTTERHSKEDALWCLVTGVLLIWGTLVYWGR